MSNSIRTAAVSLGLLALTALPASAFTINFDEAGHCTGCTGFTYALDPTGFVSGNVLIYTLPQLVTEGDVNIIDQPTGALSDDLRFTNADGTLNGLGNLMIFYSFDNDGLLADVGFIPGPTGQDSVNENADGTFTWAPGGATYNGLSGVATPLPAALPMFLGGAGLIGLLARRRKQKRTA